MKSPIRRTKMWIFCPFHRRYVSNSMVSVISVLFMRYKGGNFIIYTRHFSKLREWIASQVREIFIYFLLISVISSEPYRPSPFPATRKQLNSAQVWRWRAARAGRTGLGCRWRCSRSTSSPESSTWRTASTREPWTPWGGDYQLQLITYNGFFSKQICSQN